MAAAKSGRWSRAARASPRPTTRRRAPGRRRAASARSPRSTPTATIPRARSSRRSISALTRRERHEELIEYAIEGAVQQVKRAWDIAGGKGAININVLWEMGGAQRILHGVLERTRGLVAGVTCGAGMPYKLSARSPRPTASAICRSSARAARSARCGSAPIRRRRSGWRRWSTRTRGWRAGTTACRMPRTR